MDASNKMTRPEMLEVLRDLGVNVEMLAEKTDEYLDKRIEVEIVDIGRRPRRNKAVA